MLVLPQRVAALFTFVAVILLLGVTAEKHVSSVASMSVTDIEDALQVEFNNLFEDLQLRIFRNAH